MTQSANLHPILLLKSASQRCARKQCGVESKKEMGEEGCGGDGWFRIIPQHRPEGHAICWTKSDADAGKLKVSAHDARVHHGGKTNEATKIQIGPNDTDASLWRKVDVQVRWTDCGR